MGGAYTSEVYVIDHAAPSEAPLMGSSAQPSLLYRFGAARFGEQHDVRVVPCANAICFSVFNNGRYRSAGASCSFGSDGAQTTACASEVLLVTLPDKLSLLAHPPSPTHPSVRVQSLFDTSTVASLLTDGSSGDFLHLCAHYDDSVCLTQSRFFSLILASAQLVGSPNAVGSYLAVMVGTSGTYFEAAYHNATTAYSDVRFVYQSAGRIAATQQPPELIAQCGLPELVGLSRTRFSGWSTSVFHAVRYSHDHLTIGLCQAPHRLHHRCLSAHLLLLLLVLRR